MQMIHNFFLSCLLSGFGSALVTRIWVVYTCFCVCCLYSGVPVLVVMCRALGRTHVPFHLMWVRWVTNSCDAGGDPRAHWPFIVGGVGHLCGGGLSAHGHCVCSDLYACVGECF